MVPCLIGLCLEVKIGVRPLLGGKSSEGRASKRRVMKESRWGSTGGPHFKQLSTKRSENNKIFGTQKYRLVARQQGKQGNTGGEQKITWDNILDTRQHKSDKILRAPHCCCPQCPCGRWQCPRQTIAWRCPPPGAEKSVGRG